MPKPKIRSQALYEYNIVIAFLAELALAPATYLFNDSQVFEHTNGCLFERQLP